MSTTTLVVRADDPRAGDLPRLRGDLEGADAAAHAADVGNERDPRDRDRRRDDRRWRRAPGHAVHGSSASSRSCSRRRTWSAASSSPTGCSRCSRSSRRPAGDAMSTNGVNLLYLVTIVSFIWRCGSSRARRTRGAATGSARPGWCSRSSSRWLQDGVDSSWAIAIADGDRRRVRSRRRAPREDDRDAADGGAVQRRRRRRGGARRAGRVPQARAGSGPLHGDISVAIVLSALIGSISFAGSMVAFAKLQELIGGRPITYPGQQIVNALLFCACVARGVAIVAGARAAVAARALIAGALALRRPLRAPDRRRRHAGRDLAAERVHRASPPRRPASSSTNNVLIVERHARRRVGNAADDDDGPGDEPLDRERPLRRVRAGARRRRGDGAAATTARCARRRPRTSP